MTDPSQAGEREATPGERRDMVDFGQFRFDLETGELWRDGHAVHLAPKPARVLGVLVRSAGSLVTRRAIELGVWGDVPIDLDRSVNFAIRQIRSALGDSADSPVYIETLPKRGYRFIAPIAQVPPSRTEDENSSTVESTSSGDADPSPASRGIRRLLPLAAAASIATATWLVALDVAGSGPDGDPGRVMLAVLPLEPRDSGEDPAWFASGLTDEIIGRMTRLDPDRLGVIARTSSRRAALASRRSDADVAGQLEADYVLRGTVTPQGRDLRIAMRLTEVDGGTVLWADRYVASTPTTPDLEFEIAARVAEALRERAIPELAENDPQAPPPSPGARDALLRGIWLSRHGPDRRDQAVALMEAAVAADSSYGPAWAALGNLLLRSDRERGVAYLERAVQLSPEFVPAHVSLGRDALYRRWNMDEAGVHFRRALELEPGNVLSHHPYAYYLSIAELHDDAIRHIETALELDPVSPLVNGDVGRIYYRAQRFEEAKTQCRRTLELDPQHQIARSCLLNIAMLEGSPEAALPHARILMGKDSLALAGTSEPMRAYFESRLADLRQAGEAGQTTWVAMAQAAVFLGRTDEALDALERALRVRSPILPQVPGDPCFAVLADHPRFLAIMAEMGIP